MKILRKIEKQSQGRDGRNGQIKIVGKYDKYWCKN